MQTNAARIQKLKLLIGGHQSSRSLERLEGPALEIGIPKGVIVELLGPARTEWLIQFLKIHESFQVFWAESQQKILPTALQQRGLDLNRVVFGVFEGEMKQPLRRVIQSQLFQAIVSPNSFTEISTLKALQLLTEKANAILFLLGDKKPSHAWPISIQLEIFHGLNNNKFQIEIIKHKYKGD